MSCKVIGQGQGKVERVALQRWGECVQTVQFEASAPSTSTGERTPEDVSRLHGRIVELERSLQCDVRQAREAGYKEGEKAGREQAAQELQPMAGRMARSAAEMTTLRSRVRREAEADLVSLAIAIARRIIRRELSVDPEAIQGIVKAAIEKLQNRDISRVRVHPLHVSLVKKQLELAGAGTGVELQPDGSLQPGDLVVETRRGDLDASIDTQLREIERGFADRLGRQA
jgi:flagellar assembly protein FliH